ncbi:hypothetical protein DXG03_007295, partial [Asterophora parasitica]
LKRSLESENKTTSENQLIAFPTLYCTTSIVNMPVVDVAWDVFVAHHITTSRMLGVTSTQILRTLDGIDQAFWVETSIVDDASEDTCPASAQQSAPQLGWSSTALSLRSTSSRLHSNDLPIAAPWRVALSSNLI